MIRVPASLIAFVVVASPLAAEPVPERPLPAYPHTRALDLVEAQFGDRIADPYRWLENDVRTDSEVAGWVAAQNKLTDAYVSQLPGRDLFAARMKSLFNYERYGVPRKAANFFFYTHNDGRQNQSALYVREGFGGAPRMLLDPNGWAADGATALAEWVPNSKGTQLLYAVQDGGTDWRTLRVLDVATGKPLGDEIRWVKFSGLAWTQDGDGFFYSRFAEPERGATFQSLNVNQTVYFHKIGTSQLSDVKIYATPDRPQLGHSVQVTDDGKYLLITTSAGTDDRYELHIARLDGKAIKPRPLVIGLNYNWELAGSVGDTLYFLTNKNAPRQRLVALDARRAAAPIREVVNQTADTMVGASLVGNRIILAYLGDAKSEAELRELDGRLVSTIKLPDIGTAAGFGGKGGDSETFYSFSSFAIPPTVYRYDTATGRAEIFAQSKVAFDPADYVTEQQFFKSRDGTRVPMFIVRRKDIIGKGPAPTLLYGYGGFNISQTPGFSATRLAWLEQGGVLAIANLRGGGERRRLHQRCTDHCTAAPTSRSCGCSPRSVRWTRSLPSSTTSSRAKAID